MNCIKLMMPVCITLCLPVIFIRCHEHSPKAGGPGWHAPDTSSWSTLPDAELVRYGRSLVCSTAAYYGPHGRIKAMTNGLNCENCHLQGGTKMWAYNFSAASAMYPRFHERSGTIQTLTKKIVDCFERSMNGDAPPDSSKEMRAMLAYINWLGTGVPKHTKPAGSGTHQPQMLSRPADPAKGKLVFLHKCAACHGPDGRGVLASNGVAYTYPPLWGNGSYNTAASLFRITKLAGFIIDNMPLEKTGVHISEEEAWDVAAFVNSQPRTDKRFAEDWPVIKLKPMDYPFGPYADTFSEQQHKYGPFKAISAVYGKK